MGKRPNRRVMTRRNDCSVEMDNKKRSVSRNRRNTSVMRGVVVSRAPIGTKFVHKHSSDGSSSKRRRKTPTEQWTQKTLELGVRGVRKEFIGEVKSYVPAGDQKEWQKEENLDKNRYEDIGLLDRTRVILKKTPNGDNYIHASYAKIDEDCTFICAQGPMPDTVQSFWIMILQEDVKVIIQLCQSVEHGKEQCAEYFSATTASKSFGKVGVKTLERQTNVVGLKGVKKTKVQASYDGKTREVLHLLYTAWPDHCVADSVQTCRDVRNLVQKHSEKKPVVVHCSAGIGRTGTYVAIEMVLSRLKTKDVPSVCDVVKSLRDMRMGAVQNDQQYLFIHRMVLEVLINEDLITKDQEVMDFLKEYEQFIQRKKMERQRKTASKC